MVVPFLGRGHIRSGDLPGGEEGCDFKGGTPQTWVVAVCLTFRWFDDGPGWSSDVDVAEVESHASDALDDVVRR